MVELVPKPSQTRGYRSRSKWWTTFNDETRRLTARMGINNMNPALGSHDRIRHCIQKASVASML
jgi:hypothetical protein